MNWDYSLGIGIGDLYFVFDSDSIFRLGILIWDLEWMVGDWRLGLGLGNGD